MIKLLIFFGLLFLNLSLVQAITHPKESEQEILNRVAVDTDTIFKGRILKEKAIKNGLVFSDGDTLSIGIMEIEVLKVYRGMIHKKDKLLICTWFIGYEASFDNPNPDQRELIFFGNTINNYRVLIPDVYGYIQDIEAEQNLYKALKLKPQVKNQSDPFVDTFGNNNIIRNPCIEPITWP